MTKSSGEKEKPNFALLATRYPIKAPLFTGAEFSEVSSVRSALSESSRLSCSLCKRHWQIIGSQSQEQNVKTSAAARALLLLALLALGLEGR